jgi:GTP:adenosylcobinamide-phosphate guanylyltransferase
MEGLAKPFYKPLLEINGMPLVAYAVEYASASGVERVRVGVSITIKSSSNKTSLAY